MGNTIKIRGNEMHTDIMKQRLPRLK